MGGWGKVRAPTMARLAEAMETRPKVTGKAYAAIISRSRPAGGLGCEDKRAVAEWADACSMGCVPLKDFEAAVVSNAAIAEEMFGGDTKNAKKGVRLLVESGVVDRARQGRRGRASVYVTYPTRADVAEGSYDLPVSTGEEETGVICDPPITVENSVENENRGVIVSEYGGHDLEIRGSGVHADLGFRKHHQSTSENTSEGARSAAAGKPAPRAQDGPTCPVCGSPVEPFAGNPRMAECRSCGKAVRLEWRRRV